ncbi:hypothetical protein [Streptomyces chattanoogensis]|uniref:Uncharacterized protein n=1 Tax=Streptomyces chattanoogensis TaxID=66876 RepID=A0A0N0GXA5_9ACTN|nr:hypothetical protein [Streptomyces chattanoogensis]KPC60782.1 hypothetical protein ADL29_27825 [Streptomyces chattanoogensis]
MASETVFREPLWTTQFSPLQLRPRALSDLAINGFARYLAEHLVPFPALVHKHGTAVVVRSLRLDYVAPDLCFAHAPWLDVGVRMTASVRGEWLGITLDYRTDDRPAARARLVLRVLTVADPDSLSAHSLTRSRCEVADRWSFIGMIEPATTARERTFGIPGLPACRRRPPGRSSTGPQSHGFLPAPPVRLRPLPYSHPRSPHSGREPIRLRTRHPRGNRR